MSLIKDVEQITPDTHLFLYFPESEDLFVTDGSNGMHSDLLGESGLTLTEKVIAGVLSRRNSNFRIIPGPSSSIGIPERDPTPVKEYLHRLSGGDEIEVTIFDESSLKAMEDRNC